MAIYRIEKPRNPGNRRKIGKIQENPIDCLPIFCLFSVYLSYFFPIFLLFSGFRGFCYSVDGQGFCNPRQKKAEVNDAEGGASCRWQRITGASVSSCLIACMLCIAAQVRSGLGHTLRLLNALNSEDRGLKVRFSLATTAFDRESAQMSQILSSQGKNAPSNPYPCVFPVEPQSPNGKNINLLKKWGFRRFQKRVPKSAGNRTFCALFAGKTHFQTPILTIQCV